MAGDERLHAVGARLPHFVGAMAVKIQRKGCCGVTQVFLHGFDVVPRAERIHCVGVPEVMNEILSKDSTLTAANDADTAPAFPLSPHSGKVLPPPHDLCYHMKERKRKYDSDNWAS